MDKYSCYQHLSENEIEGRDYRIVAVDRDAVTVIIAPHGGHIEPGSSEIAAATADQEHSLYMFEGLKSGRPHRDLHIASENFDEPKALEIVGRSDLVIAVHGRADIQLCRADPKTTWVGGLEKEVGRRIIENLESVGFPAIRAELRLTGMHPNNVCNRGRTKKGVQLEIPRSLRDNLRADDEELHRYSQAIRSAIPPG